jgi:hypothetical protein
MLTVKMSTSELLIFPGYKFVQRQKDRSAIKWIPDDERVPSDLGEAEAEDDDPEVVEEGQGHDHGPVVAEPPGGIEHERPVASVGRK